MYRQRRCARVCRRPASSRHPSSRREARKDFAFVEAKKAFLVGPDLVDMDVVEARVDALLDSLDMTIGVGAAEDRARNRLFGHHADRLLEVRGVGEHLWQLSGKSYGRHRFVRDLSRLCFI